MKDRRIVCLGIASVRAAFTHVREGHAPAGVAHTRMARRRTNQYRATPGCAPRPSRPSVSQYTISHQPHLPRVISPPSIAPFSTEDRRDVWTTVREYPRASSRCPALPPRLLRNVGTGGEKSRYGERNGVSELNSRTVGENQTTHNGFLLRAFRGWDGGVFSGIPTVIEFKKFRDIVVRGVNRTNGAR